MKKISVVVPVYNVEKYLEKCIDSIINQTYRNLEIILVDDGSSDKSPQICDLYAQKDERVKVIHKTNGGLSSARNVGIDCATGEYICFFDSDDFVEIDMIETLSKAIMETDYDLCICGYSVDTYNKTNALISQKSILPNFSYPSTNCSLDEYEFALGLCGYAWNKLYRLQFLKENNLKFEEGVSLVEDLLFNERVFANNAKFVFLSYVGYHYIQRERESLGVKYYENYFDLKLRALNAKCSILKIWGIEENKITQFYKNNYVDAVWGTIKGIQRSALTKVDKLQKSKNFFDKYNIRKSIKNDKIQGKKRKIKKFILSKLPIKILLKIVK